MLNSFKNTLRKFIFKADAHQGNIYTGNYSSWNEAKTQCQGYDAPAILAKTRDAMFKLVSGEAVYERDTVLFDEIQYAFPLLSALLYVGTTAQNQLRVLDFGGALGSSYYQNRRLLNHIHEFNWSVVEQSHYVECGKSEFTTQQLRFFFSVDECIEASNPNFVLLSGVLNYLEKPYELLESLLKKNVPFVFLDRTPAAEIDNDRLVIQHVPASIYETSYPIWIFNSNRLHQLFEKCGYEIIYRFEAHIGSYVEIDELKIPYQGWFLKKL